MGYIFLCYIAICVFLIMSKLLAQQLTNLYWDQEAKPKEGKIFKYRLTLVYPRESGSSMLSRDFLVASSMQTNNTSVD